MRLLGAVIAGGQSRRFGSDKAMARLHGIALIDHVIARLAPQVAEVVVCGRRHPPLRALADRPAPGLGPLGGLAAALAYAREANFDAVLAAACDAPDLSPNLAVTLIGCTPAVAIDCPVAGFWPAHLAATLDRHLEATPDRSLRAWAAAVDARSVSVRVANVNTPADLAELERAWTI